MTQEELRWVLRGMSIARGVLTRDHCPARFHIAVRNYQEEIAAAFHLAVDDHDAEMKVFQGMIAEINNAIALKHPDWVNQQGERWKIRQ